MRPCKKRIGLTGERWGVKAIFLGAVGLLKVFLRVMETTVRPRSPGARADARFGAVAF
jgi:hypothetical protein